MKFQMQSTRSRSVLASICVFVVGKASEVAPKTPASKNAVVAATTETASADEQSDDNAPTPKHWSSEWDPTLNSLLSAYVQQLGTTVTPTVRNFK